MSYNFRKLKKSIMHVPIRMKPLILDFFISYFKIPCKISLPSGAHFSKAGDFKFNLLNKLKN